LVENAAGDLFVGRCGRVSAIEIDPALAAQAGDNLAAAWPQATVVAADGVAFRHDRPADAIVGNSGVTHFSSVWLDTLAAENGRLLVPLTNADRWGCFLMITRRAGEPNRYAASFVGRVGSSHASADESGGRGKIDGGESQSRFHRHPLAAARARRGGSHMLARRRGLVAIDRPRAHAVLGRLFAGR